MSAMVPVPSIAAEHFFAGTHGHVFVMLYKPKDNTLPGTWETQTTTGALALDEGERIPAMADAVEFARATWPEARGLLIVDYRGHRA